MGPGAKAVTPVTRLNWEDLLEPNGPAETNENTSPNDKILWNNQQDSLYASALSPMLQRKGKKRARSSSPTSSPANDRPSVPTVNVEKLTKALRSPHADPTLELWDRYSLNGPENITTPTGAVNPALAQLMISSSPKPVKDMSNRRGDANLRRAISCGLNWPKRRKIERSKSGSQNSSQQREMEAASKSSLVTALLDTVTSSINEQSPSTTQDRLMRSPSPNKKPLSPIQDTPCRRVASLNKSSSSDYGDDDFDDDEFMEFEASLQVTDTLDTLSQENKELEMLQQLEKGTTKSIISKDEDEFEDLDDGIFDNADAIAQVSEPCVGKIQSQAQTTPHLEQAKGPEPCKDSDSTLDEFEVDFDGDIDFDAVELDATQSVQQLNTPSATVCQNTARLSQCSIY